MDHGSRRRRVRPADALRPSRSLPDVRHAAAVAAGHALGLHEPRELGAHQVRRLPGGAEGQRHLLVTLERRGRQDHGPHGDRDGRQGAHAPPRAGPARVRPARPRRAPARARGDAARDHRRPGRQAARRHGRALHRVLPGAGDGPHGRHPARRLPAVPALGDRPHRLREGLSPGLRRIRRRARVPPADHRRAPRAAVRGRHQHAGHGHGRRPGTERRGGGELPPAADSGGRGDHVPPDRQHALRAPHRARPLGARARRPHAGAVGRRGDAALGDLGADGLAADEPRGRDPRQRDPGGRADLDRGRVGEPRRGPLRESRRLRSRPARRRPPGVRLRPPPLPRLPPRAPRGPAGAGRRARPFARPAPRPGSAAADDHRPRLPLAEDPAGAPG